VGRIDGVGRVTSTVVAWQWHGCVSWLSATLHGLGAFATSAGFGGLAALGAAVIAADQVRKTRNRDNIKHTELRDADNKRYEDDRKIEETNRKREALWDRFEWVIDQTRADSGGTRTLGLTEVNVMPEAMETRCAGVDDEHLELLIQQVQDRS
jgi:hypothetical protein